MPLPPGPAHDHDVGGIQRQGGQHVSNARRGRYAPAQAAAHVFQTEAARELEGLLDKWREKYPGVPVSQDVVHGHPGRALAGLSARADLVVLGRRAVHHGPGTVIHAVLNHAHGPVATVPSGPEG